MEKRLGKGLEALIAGDTGKVKGKVEKINLKDIVPNPFQPRKRFNEDRLDELVSSIKEKGVIQPILVRPSGVGYEVIAGERRWRAAQKLGIGEIPAIVRTDIDDASSLEISIIENIQREELNPIEEANAYQELIGKFEYTLDKVGQMMGKDKTTISNTLRLLTLSNEMRALVEDGKISMGHAKAILSLVSEAKRQKIVRAILNKGISVRETEQMVKRISEARTKQSKVKDPEIQQVEESLQHRLGTKVTIHQGKKRGHIEIQYFSNDDLQRVLELILR